MDMLSLLLKVWVNSIIYTLKNGFGYFNSDISYLASYYICLLLFMVFSLSYLKLVSVITQLNVFCNMAEPPEL